MSTLAIQYGTGLPLTFSGLNLLAAGSQVASSTVDNSTALAVDYEVEVTIADVSEAGNKQVVVYAISSIDNTTFSDSANVFNMARLGFIDLTGTGPQTMRCSSIAAAFGGIVPKFFKVVVLNDAGVSLASSRNSGRVVPLTFTAA